MPNWKLVIQAWPLPVCVKDVMNIYITYFWQKWKTSKNSQVTQPHSETQHSLLVHILQQCLIQDGFAGFALSPSLFHTVKDSFASDLFSPNLLHFSVHGFQPDEWLFLGLVSFSRYVSWNIPFRRMPSSIISTHTHLQLSLIRSAPLWHCPHVTSLRFVTYIGKCYTESDSAAIGRLFPFLHAYKMGVCGIIAERKIHYLCH